MSQGRGCKSAHNFCPDWLILTTIGWIAIYSFTSLRWTVITLIYDLFPSAVLCSNTLNWDAKHQHVGKLPSMNPALKSCCHVCCQPCLTPLCHHTRAAWSFYDFTCFQLIKAAFVSHTWLLQWFLTRSLRMTHHNIFHCRHEDRKRVLSAVNWGP